MGYGSIGQELHQQILNKRKEILERENISLNIIGITNSKIMILKDRIIDLEAAKSVSDKNESLDQTDTDELINHMIKKSASKRILVDTSASDETPDLYKKIFENGISIVTANKKGLSGEIDKYHSVMNSKISNDVDFLYETTAGAALPFIKSVSDIASSSDKVRKIEGIFSGTAAYLFNTFDTSIPFSALVNEALQQGYTEPDPRAISLAWMWRNWLFLQGR